MKVAPMKQFRGNADQVAQGGCKSLRGAALMRFARRGDPFEKRLQALESENARLRNRLTAKS
jgi:hypothetical protein